MSDSQTPAQEHRQNDQDAQQRTANYESLECFFVSGLDAPDFPLLRLLRWLVIGENEHGGSWLQQWLPAWPTAAPNSAMDFRLHAATIGPGTLSEHEEPQELFLNVALRWARVTCRQIYDSYDENYDEKNLRCVGRKSGRGRVQRLGSGKGGHQ
jgi:hypothetical protein